MNERKEIEDSVVQVKELLADREAAIDDMRDMRHMIKFLTDRCHQLEDAYNDRETRFREEMRLKDEKHKREMVLAMVSKAEVSELESRVEALSDIKHELSFRLHQLQGGVQNSGDGVTSSSSPTCGCCFERPVGTVVLPCRHLVLCYHCARQLTSCPVCRSPVNDRLDVFI